MKTPEGTIIVRSGVLKGDNILYCVESPMEIISIHIDNKYGMKSGLKFTSGFNLLTETIIKEDELFVEYHPKYIASPGEIIMVIADKAISMTARLVLKELINETNNNKQ